MPKRSLDASNVTPAAMGVEKMHKKTERSHEENQERAYIAASRRADRSIEARVQSARMASEIHKKRTGKGFKISEQIVQAEEMYEEEEDDMPRSYRMLAAHLQTNSPTMNYRVNAYLANRVAMASIAAGMANEDWLQNPINKMFAEQFPDANKHAQQLSQKLSNSAYYGPVHGQTSQADTVVTSPISPTFEQLPFQQPQYQAHAHSIRSPSDTSTMRDATSPPALTPGSTSTMEQASRSQSMSSFPTMAAMDPAMFSSDSSFTAELPMDAKMMLPNIDPNDPLYYSFFGNEPMNSMQYYTDDSAPRGIKSEYRGDNTMPSEEFFTNNLNPYTKFDAPTHRSTNGTPAGGDSWESLVDYDCGDLTTDAPI